jgi:hypothetical protein
MVCGLRYLICEGMLMLSSDHTNIPLSETEILNIRNNLKNYDYEVLTKLENIILAIRTDRDHPDLMEDLENVYHQFNGRFGKCLSPT